MTAGASIDPREVLHEHLAQASPDLLRQLMEGSSTPCCPPMPTACAVPRTGPVRPTASTGRNGHRHRGLDTRSGPWTWRSPSRARGPTSRTGGSRAALSPGAGGTPDMARRLPAPASPSTTRPRPPQTPRGPAVADFITGVTAPVLSRSTPRRRGPHHLPGPPEVRPAPAVARVVRPRLPGHGPELASSRFRLEGGGRAPIAGRRRWWGRVRTRAADPPVPAAPAGRSLG